MPPNWKLITPEAMGSLELDKMAEAAPDKDCSSYSVTLAALLKDEARWNPSQLEALRFSGAAMSIMLRSDQPSEPYGPMFAFGDGGSPIPTDFPREGLLALLPWAAILSDSELRARFLDIIWVQGRDFDAAQGAVKAYVESACQLESEKWSRCEKRIERALRLAASLGKGGGKLRADVLNETEAMALRQRDHHSPYLTLRLIRLLLEFKHGDTGRIAQLANAAAEKAESTKDFWRARDYHQVTADCYGATGDATAQAASLRRSAEALVMEADGAVAQAGRGAIAGAGILAQAIDAMRKAPGGKQRADELHDRLLELQTAAVSELRPISTSIDTTGGEWWRSRHRSCTGPPT